jgi:hypothetical protein
MLGTWGTLGCGLIGQQSLEFVVMIQVWQVGIINTQGFENYFSLMERELREFCTGWTIDRAMGKHAR